jgi:hypothetical protein
MSIALLLTTLLARAEDAPVATGDSTPQGTVGMSGSDVYVIQPGDTLWAISQQFLGDSQAWPQLWSVNTYITNPHWIYPGNRISFRLGDTLNPPSADMSGAGGSVATSGAGEVSGPACGFPAMYDRTYAGMRLVAPGVIGTASTLNLRGSVYGTDKPGAQVGAGAYVYVEMKGAASLECGEPLAIYRRQGDKLKGREKQALGYVYRVMAMGEVVRVDGEMVTLRLRDSYHEVVRGDVVGDPTPVDLELDVAGPGVDGLEARVMARLHDEQLLATVGETVFLDRGVEDGIDVGASLFVVERRDGLAMFRPEDARLPERVVGRVVVVRAESQHATGVVVDAARDIDVGARLTTRPNGE